MALSTDHTTSLGYLETGDDRLNLRRQLEQCNPGKINSPIMVSREAGSDLTY